MFDTSMQPTFVHRCQKVKGKNGNRLEEDAVGVEESAQAVKGAHCGQNGVARVDRHEDAQIDKK